MKTTICGLIGGVLLWSGSAAAADPFVSCEDAANYGYNTVVNSVSATYNRAECDRDLVTQYEGILTLILPTYLSAMAERTTEQKGACLLQGSYEGWMATVQDEYLDCRNVPGFEAIERALLGSVSGSLLQPFYGIARNYYTPENVAVAFAFPYESLSLTGAPAECEAEIRVALSGVPSALANALVATVCQ